LFPYFYDGTTMDKYKSALAVESMGCCVTKIDNAKSNGIGKKSLVSWSYSFNEIYYMILFIA
jgi:hypothetical protein